MRKYLVTLLILFFLAPVFGQDLIFKYKKADSLFKANQYKEAYRLFSGIENVAPKEDTIYLYSLWYTAQSLTILENDFRMNEQFDSSLYYGLKSIPYIEKGENYYGKKFTDRKYWMYKNILVAYFSLNNIEKYKEYKKILYDAAKENILPEGLNEYFNFTYFKFEDKNIWGYEWFEELPEDRFSRSFSKIVYYVYSTDTEGNDKDQLYRLHVLMFHKTDKSIDFDYVLTLRVETATDVTGGTLYSYTYKEDIDYKKLQADIKEVLKGNYQPEVESYQKK